MDRPNLLLIVIDSLRADRLGCYGHDRPTSPHIDALAAEGVRFDGARSETSWTLPSGSTLFTGLAPREHGAESSMSLPGDIPTLAQGLSAAGYRTVAASACHFIGRTRGLHRGFDEFYMPAHAVRVSRTLIHHFASRNALADSGGAAVMARLARTLAGAPQPWFAMAWLFDTHSPYLAPRPYTGRFSDDGLPRKRWRAVTNRMRKIFEFGATATPRELQDSRDLYDGCVGYDDMLVGRLRDALTGAGVWDDTVVVVTADHGEMLGEKSLMGHGLGADVYEPVIRVPLVVRAPGRVPEGVGTPAPVQLADVTRFLARLGGAEERLAPTAAETCDLAEAASGAGRPYTLTERVQFNPRSVRKVVARNPEFDAQRHICHMAAVVRDGWKYIHRTSGRHELFDLGDDPAEERSLLDSEPQRAAEMMRLVAEWQDRAPSRLTDKGRPIADDPAVAKRLEDLGYY